MTPACCDRAWVKAHNTKAVTCDRSSFCDEGWYPETAEFMHSTHAHGMSGIPDAESAEWLAEICEAAQILRIHRGMGDTLVIWGTILPEATESNGVDVNLRRALCAALNGKPCERKTA